MRKLSKVMASTPVSLKASFTKMALVEKNTAPNNVIRNPETVNWYAVSFLLFGIKPV